MIASAIAAACTVRCDRRLTSRPAAPRAGPGAGRTGADELDDGRAPEGDKTDLSMGAFFALVIAGSGLTILGIGPAILGPRRRNGRVVMLERPALTAAWRTGSQARTAPRPDRTSM